MKYKVDYYYLATGMEGNADEYSYTIKADTELEAVYKAHRKYGFWKGKTFEEFKNAPKWEQYWGTTVKKL